MSKTHNRRDFSRLFGVDVLWRHRWITSGMGLSHPPGWDNISPDVKIGGHSCLKSEQTYTLNGFGLGFFRIYVDLAVFQPYLDLAAGDNQSLKIQVARPGIEPRSSCSASQELNHSATAAPLYIPLM